MIKLEKKCEDNILVSAFCEKEFDVSHSLFLSLLKNKDIKVNEKRIKEDVLIKDGDMVTVFTNQEKIKKPYEIVFIDDNIIIVNKFESIEVCDGERNLKKYLERDYDKVLPVHRIDMFTKGLVVFARNSISEKCLKTAFKQHKIDKIYYAECYGEFKEKNKTMKAYLLKDSETAQVKIYDKPVKDSKEIITSYKLLKQKDLSAVLEVKLETGRTHQIRAHLAYINHPIIGDGKYGKNEYNKIFKEKYQRLVSGKLIFHFAKNEYLYYLNDRSFELKQPF